MIKQSKHNIHNITNSNKLRLLDSIFVDYKLTVEHYMSLILNKTLPFNANLSSKLLPVYGCIIQSKWKRECYKKASMALKSTYKKSSNNRYNTYKRVYSYFKKQNRQLNFLNKRFSELKLNDLIDTKYYIKPCLNNISIELGKEFIDIKESNHFDNFVRILTPYPSNKGYLRVKIPLKQHRHSNALVKSGYVFKGSITLKQRNNEYYIHLNYEKEVTLKVLKEINALGIDVGKNKLITTSRNEFIGSQMNLIYDKICRKTQGSKAFLKALIERDNLTNYHCNKLDLADINVVVVEGLNNLKKGKGEYKSLKQKQAYNKLQRWSYVKTLDKIKGMCEDQGITLVEVNPAYTSQTCSECHNIDKDSRTGEKYLCVKCGYQIDADYNASINIRNRGVYSLSNSN